MNKYTFPQESETSVFINGNNGITVMQIDSGEEQWIAFSSRRRAVAVARIIIAMAKQHDFPEFTEEPEQEA